MSVLRSAWVAPAGVLALLLLYAIAAFGSGVDRMSSANPSLSRHVPSFLQANALRADASVALAKSEFAEAEILAGRALAAAPSDYRTPALLGAARLLRGDEEAARRPMGVALRGGWRDPLPHAFALNEALASSDPSAAIPHFVAIWRARPHFPLGERLFEAIVANPISHAALAKRLIEHQMIARELLAVHADDPSSAAALRAEFLLSPAFDEQPLGCSMVNSLVEGLIARRMNERAEQVSLAHCDD